MNSEYLETNEVADVISSLRMTLVALKKTGDDPHDWKWVILALHSAIQGSMVCHLSDTANLGALTKKSTIKMLEYFNSREKIEYPNGRLASPKELFERLWNKEKRGANSGAGDVIRITVKQKKSFQRLCELRNMFTHFKPMSWLIELNGLPNMTLQIAEIIELISADGWPFRHATSNQRSELATLINDIKMRSVKQTKHPPDGGCTPVRNVETNGCT